MESMIVLVDSGATKAEWCVLEGDRILDIQDLHRALTLMR